MSDIVQLLHFVQIRLDLRSENTRVFHGGDAEKQGSFWLTWLDCGMTTRLKFIPRGLPRGQSYGFSKGESVTLSFGRFLRFHTALSEIQLISCAKGRCTYKPLALAEKIQQSTVTFPDPQPKFAFSA